MLMPFSLATCFTLRRTIALSSAVLPYRTWHTPLTAVQKNVYTDMGTHLLIVSTHEGKPTMGFAVEYILPSGTSGVIFFAAADMTEAVSYVSLLCSHYGHVNVTNLTQLPVDVTVADLYRLFPSKQTSNKSGLIR
jgi:hypothetical protein